MHTHFDQHLNLRKIILDRKPKVIVECGAGKGECTRLIAHLQPLFPFVFYVISDNHIDGITPEPIWKTGLSFDVLKEFPDNSIDLCIIDTDHNYWTLAKELEAVKDKMSEGGVIVFHDVDEFYHNTGMAMSYWNDVPYPVNEIKDNAKHGGTGLALLDFLVAYRGSYKLLYWVKENYGAAVIEKKTVIDTQIVMPAGSPVFAKPYAPEPGSA